ncbi:MAG TPA: hypothetical protein VF303_03745 [Candidatus Nanoarchaeia archaeon]
MENNQPIIKKTPKSFNLTVALLVVTALFWFAYAIYALAFRPAAIEGMAMPALIAAVVFSLLTFFVYKRKLWAYWVGLIFVVANVLLTIMDEVGYADLFYLALSVVILGLSVKSRSVFRKLPSE